MCALWAGQYGSPKRPEGPQEGIIHPKAVLHPQNTDSAALVYTQTDYQVQAGDEGGGGSLKMVNIGQMNLSNHQYVSLDCSLKSFNSNRADVKCKCQTSSVIWQFCILLWFQLETIKREEV